MYNCIYSKIECMCVFLGKILEVLKFISKEYFIDIVIYDIRDYMFLFYK